MTFKRAHEELKSMARLLDIPLQNGNKPSKATIGENFIVATQKHIEAYELAIMDISHDCNFCKYSNEDYPDNAPHCDKCMKPNYCGGVYCSGVEWAWRYEDLDTMKG
jgi:hypothetical protein